MDRFLNISSWEIRFDKSTRKALYPIGFRGAQGPARTPSQLYNQHQYMRIFATIHTISRLLFSLSGRQHAGPLQDHCRSSAASWNLDGEEDVSCATHSLMQSRYRDHRACTRAALSTRPEYYGKLDMGIAGQHPRLTT